MTRTALLLAVLLAGCPGAQVPGEDTPDASVPDAPRMGAHWRGDGVDFRVASQHATRIQLEIFDGDDQPVLQREMQRDPDAAEVWTARVDATELPATIAYGYRAWGPNWPYDPAWTPGAQAGHVVDVDADGNRMNPNKLLFDPYGLELTHDAGAKSLVLREEAAAAPFPRRALADEVIYEVHLRGFTEADPVPCAGTYAGAAARAGYLADLGVTAVEFLPIAETRNDANDDVASTQGDNYWGYSTLAYFAPDRRYACDRSPGGPTREVREMVRAFHDRGIEVLLDVVYNHTAEGSGGVLSLRGLDNAGYYQLDRAGTGFTNDNGVGADLAADKPLVQALVLDSLRYWHEQIGVDGFRFDLAPVLGNACGPGCFRFDPTGLPQTIAREIDAHLIAEPWAVTSNGYAAGKFPAPWAEWNDKFRDTIREDQNQVGIIAITPGALAARIGGSHDVYAARTPAAGVSYLVSHDGFTLHDLYACDAPRNAQAWPYGPSDGGSSDNHAWDHDGDAAAQRQATRTGLALMMLSAGVPMITGGDEMGRTVRCNNNPYNLDSPASWLDWAHADEALRAFAAGLIHLRAAHPALHPAQWAEPAWLDGHGATATAAYLADASKTVLAWRAGDVYAAYNRGTSAVTVTLPAPPAGRAWVRVADTAMDALDEHVMQQADYGLSARALAIFVAR